MSSEALFRGFEQDYQELANVNKQDIAQLTSQTGEKRKQIGRKVSKALDTARDLIRSMDTEANSMATKDVKERLKRKVQSYRQDLDNMTNDFDKVNSSSSSSRPAYTDRSSLLGAQEEIETYSKDNRGRLAESQAALERSNNSLMNSLAMMEETETIGAEASQTLKGQGEQIRRTHEKVYEMNSDIRRGSKLIGNMTRRQLTNRLILLCVILALLAVIGVILYFVIKALVDKYGPTPAPTPAPTTTHAPTKTPGFLTL